MGYFFVRDLFGDDDVEVVPSNPSLEYGKIPNCGTIEMIVRLASIVIKCHGQFDVYPKHLVGECEPLIQLHTTTTETIQLHEVRVETDDADQNQKGENDGNENEPTMLILQEKKTKATGNRHLSIRPAKYKNLKIGKHSVRL